MIELYIENKKIDITDDLEINFTYEQIDPDKLSSIKNSFSKTVNIPGTQNNNFIFGYIFRYDRYLSDYNQGNIEYEYDPHKKVNWFINKNGALINRGYCTLDNIIVKNDYEYTYQLTLYGGIGEFFYNLSYNEDGSPKTLYDLYWNWTPKLDADSNGGIYADEGTTPENENQVILYDGRSRTIAESYHNLSPLYPYNGNTLIDRDVVFVPCYTGLYEDFDAKTMLVNTMNQNMSAPIKYISDNTKQILQNSFPDSFEYDEKTYTTLNKNFDPLDTDRDGRYGIVKFSRDIYPYEAGELRINELPVAIRLSKMMNVISQPINNGGYTVEWDESITTSPYWLYSYVLMNKLKQDKNIEANYTISYDEITNAVDYNKDIADVNATYNDSQNMTLRDKQGIVTEIEQGTYSFFQELYPTLDVEAGLQIMLPSYQTNHTWAIDSCAYAIIPSANNISYFFKSTYILITVFKLRNNVIKTIADVFYINNSHRYSYTDDEAATLKQPIINHFNRLGLTGIINIDEINIHNLSTYNITTTGHTSKILHLKFGTEEVKTNLEIDTRGTFEVTQYSLCCWTYDGKIGNNRVINSGVYGTQDDARPEPPSPFQEDLNSFFGVPTTDSFQKSKWPFYSNNDRYSFQLENAEEAGLQVNNKNGIFVSKSSGYRPLQIDKKILFANSKSPMEYLSGFCKLMNYKFICDDTAKIIYIKDFKHYHQNNIYDLNNRVDIGRDINIKNVTADYKNINIGLSTPETYPVDIFNRTSKDKFNIKRYDTNIEYPLPDTDLLNDNIFENTIDWQQSSIFYNIYNQFPKAYNTTTISWNLFYKDPQKPDNIQTAEKFTLGVASTYNTLLAVHDPFPKNALFNKELKMTDFNASLIFLNGFVKNYDHTRVFQGQEQGNFYIISPRLLFSNDNYEQYYLNQGRCYQYDFSYESFFFRWGYTAEDRQTMTPKDDGSSAPWVIPMFTKDLYQTYDATNGWSPSSYKIASWNFTQQDGLDGLYDLSETYFIKDTNFSYSVYKTEQTIGDVYDNEYRLGYWPSDNIQTEEAMNVSRIYDTKWKNYLDDLYDRNARDVVAYIDLSGLGDANTIMRNIYSWKSHLWIITKLENFKIAETVKDKFTKVTLHKIKSISTWIDS